VQNFFFLISLIYKYSTWEQNEIKYSRFKRKGGLAYLITFVGECTTSWQRVSLKKQRKQALVKGERCTGSFSLIFAVWFSSRADQLAKLAPRDWRPKVHIAPVRLNGGMAWRLAERSGERNDENAMSRVPRHAFRGRVCRGYYTQSLDPVRTKCLAARTGLLRVRLSLTLLISSLDITYSIASCLVFARYNFAL